MNKAVCFSVFFLVVCVFAATLDEAHQQLDALTNIATQNVQVGMREMNSQANRLRTLSVQVEDDGSKLVNLEYSRLLKEFNYIILIAQNEGINVTLCTKSADGILKEMGLMSNLEVRVCVNRFLTQAQESITKAMVEFNRHLEIVYTLRTELASCKDTDKTCIDNAYQKIVFQEVDVPRNIQESQNVATNKAEANRLMLLGCGNREAQKMLTQGGKVLADLEKCLDEHAVPPKP